MRLATLATGLLLISANTTLSQTEADAGGTLNPEELTLNRVMKDVAEGRTSMTICATGYYITKWGRHEMARERFERCAAAGWTHAMTWMSQLDGNGLGGAEDPDTAAEWDLRAAEAGDPIGKLNYGLDLMRGRDVAENRALGRQYIDEAARSGLPTAKRLCAADYDLDVVTPDADNWKYAPAF